MAKSFDEYADAYDKWFIENPNVLASEVALVAATLKDAKLPILSVGCGSGLFEYIMRKDYDINIVDGVEPSTGMAEIARKRGMDVAISTGEDFNYPIGRYGTILFNGSPSYIIDLRGIVAKVYDALPIGGSIVLVDVPKESSYGIMYNLAKTLGTWDHPLLEGVYPPNPYPIEFVNVANWCTTAEKISILEDVGFKNIRCMQTLTTHPLYSDLRTETPVDGCDRGDYVAVIATK